MNTTLIIMVTVLIGFLLMIVWGRHKLKNTPVVEDNEHILKLTDKNFNHQTKDKTVLVDFWAEWCAPCRMMAPVLNEVADELKDKAYVGKVNVEEYQSLAQRYQVRNIPTMILFKNGKEAQRFVGVKSKEFLVQQINKTK